MSTECSDAGMQVTGHRPEADFVLTKFTQPDSTDVRDSALATSHLAVGYPGIAGAYCNVWFSHALWGSEFRPHACMASTFIMSCLRGP